MLKKILVISFFILFITGCITHTFPSTKKQNIAILQLNSQGHTSMVNDLLISKYGDIITASDDKTIRVWDSHTGKEKKKILGEIGDGKKGMIYAIALSPNEQFLAVGVKINSDETGDKRGIIRIYNYQIGTLTQVINAHNKTILDLAFSSDGHYLISGAKDKLAKIWNVNNNFSLLDTIKFHSNYIYGVKIIKKDNNYRAVTVSDDGQILLYSLKDRKVIKSEKKPYSLNFLASNQNNIAMCGFEGNKIWIYDFDLKPIKTIESKTQPNGLAYSPNGELLIAGVGSEPNRVSIYSVKNNYQEKSSFTKHQNTVLAVGFLDNNRAVSVGGENNEIYIWDIETQEVKKKIEGVGAKVWSVGIHGDEIAWGTKWSKNYGKSSLEKSINLTDLKKGIINSVKRFKQISSRQKGMKLIHKKGGHYAYENAILVLKKDDKEIEIKRNALNGYKHNCYGFYKNYIISGGANGVLKIYNFKGKEVANLLGHTGEVWALALDGDRLVSGASDQIIKIWDLSKLKQTMQPQLSIFSTKSNDWIAWTPQGFYNASKGAEKYIGYHINQGSNKEAQFLDISRFKKQFYRPDLITKAIKGEDISSYATNIDIANLLNAGLPPKVKILTNSLTMNKESTKIKVNICDMGGGFDNLNFYLDGKIIKSLNNTTALTIKKKIIKNCTYITEQISVPSGKYTLSFDATNKEGNILSNRANISITNNKRTETKPNLHLFTITLNEYKDKSLNLKFSNNDAKELAEKLKIIGKPIFENIHTYALKDAQVTKEQIDTKMREIALKVNVNDVFILYMSGHGITSSSNGDYYFIPYDYPNGANLNQAINQDKFKKIMSQIKAVKSIILIDTCQSGSMASSELINTSIKRFGGNVGSAIIAGATSRQKAIDGYKKHGIFTYTILDAMENKKVYSFDNKLSINEVAEYSKYLLPKLAKEKFGHEQNPAIYMNGDTTFAIGGI